MNNIVLIGRMVKDPELKHTKEQDKVYSKFIIAVDRNFKLADGTRECDFIPIVVWGKKAEVICKYMKKGDSISIIGRLRMDRYEDEDNNKKYITEVVADNFKFISTNKKIEEA